MDADRRCPRGLAPALRRSFMGNPNHSWHLQHQEAEFRDELVRVFADVPDRPENRQFFADFKEQLKSRFRQHDIWITTYPIEVI